jgi:hypothetical protein
MHFDQVEESATCIVCALEDFTVEGLFLSTIFYDTTNNTYCKHLIVTYSIATLDRPLFHWVTLSMTIQSSSFLSKMKKHHMETLVDAPLVGH